MFNRTLKRIINVLKTNYMAEFNRRQIQDLNRAHSSLQPPLGFNSLNKQGSLPDKAETGRQANIFAAMASR